MPRSSGIEATCLPALQLTPTHRTPPPAPPRSPCVRCVRTKGEAERQALSPTGVAHLSQNVLLPVLLEEAHRAAVKSCPLTQVMVAPLFSRRLYNRPYNGKGVCGADNRTSTRFAVITLQQGGERVGRDSIYINSERQREGTPVDGAKSLRRISPWRASLELCFFLVRSHGK